MTNLNQAQKTEIAEMIQELRLNIVNKYEHTKETEETCQAFMVIEDKLRAGEESIWTLLGRL